MKRYGNLFAKMLEWENLLLATKNAAHGGRKYQPKIAEFLFHKESELLQLKNDLSTKNYIPSDYRQFVIYDPKKRLINVAHFRDRVVHHALCNQIAPILDKTLISTSFACREEKGMHRALALAKNWAKQCTWFLKLDIAKYFDSISHSLLQQALERKIKDKDILWLTWTIINKVPKNFQEGYGLPIGNLTSQHFANYYLSSLDHHIKQVLSIPVYMRYMDDMLLLASDKMILLHALQEIYDFVHNHLDLRLKPTATILAPIRDGIPFLGFRVYRDYTLIQKKNWRRFQKKMRWYQERYLQDDMNAESLQMRMTTMINHLELGDTYHLRRKFIDKYTIEV